MKRLYILTMLMSMLAAFGAPAVFAGADKVEVCHVPPGNPDNFHTITISEHALAAHLDHGDIEGPCNAVCADLCDDGDACTIDDTADCEQLGCPVTREAVNCDDGLLCTVDACDSVQGCVYPDVVCDEGETCNPNNGFCEDDVVSCPCYDLVLGNTKWTSTFLDGAQGTGASPGEYQFQVWKNDGTNTLEAVKLPENEFGACNLYSGTSFDTRPTNQAQHEACYQQLLDLYNTIQ